MSCFINSQLLEFTVHQPAARCCLLLLAAACCCLLLRDFF